MRLLLDTHAVAWWFVDDERLPRLAYDAIADPGNDVFVSAVGPWEMATKYRLGKWPTAALVLAQLDEALEIARFRALPISFAHARRAGGLDGSHRDPFDRMLAAQSLLEGLALVTNDTAFATFGVPVLWGGAEA